MGRQIEIAMAHGDEEFFLAFLRASAEVVVYRSWSPAPEAVADIAQEESASTFWMHNTAFSWKPTFERVDYTDRVSGKPGIYYRLETRHAPLIEYSRHPLEASAPQVGGRLYWSKLFASQREQIEYDLAAFEAWYTRVAKWVHKHGTRISHGNTQPWCLPEARRRLENEP